MNQEDLYKYLGYNQARGIDHKLSKETLTKAFKQRLKAVMRTQLNGKNKITAINTYAISLLTYSFGILRWTDTELEALNRTVRTMATKYRFHHPKSATERFHLPRKYGGRGVQNIKQLHWTQVQNLKMYFTQRTENNNLYQIMQHLKFKGTPLNTEDVTQKLETINQVIDRWKGKALHGKYPTQLSERGIDDSASMSWIRDGTLFCETEGMMFAIQDQVMATRYYRKHIIGENINDRCRMCQDKGETIDHLITACPILAPTDYTMRHNMVARIIHQELLRQHLPNVTYQPYYKYEPQGVVETLDMKLYWARPISTDKNIPHNIPDIIITQKEQKNTFIIDIAVPNVANITKKYNEKITKYLPLAMEIKEMWKQDAVHVIPVIVGATGEIPVNLQQSLQHLNINYNIYKLMQKAVVLNTCAIVRKVLNHM